METKVAKIWIENNPNTGEVKPWEVWFQSEGTAKTRVASCQTEEGANKSLGKTVKRNAPYYKIEVC